MRPRFRNSRSIPVRSARLDVELLEDRLPISENFGTLLAVSTLAGAAEALLAHLPPTQPSEVDRAVEPSDHLALAADSKPNGLTVTDHVALVDAPRAEKAAGTSQSPLLVDTLVAAWPEDGLEPNVPASAASYGGTSAELGPHSSGDFVGFGYTPSEGASAFGAGFAGAAAGPAPAYAGLGLVASPPFAAPSSSNSPYPASPSAAVSTSSPDSAALWQSVNSLSRTPPAGPKPPSELRPLDGSTVVTVMAAVPLPEFPVTLAA
jgi:hypothetical protein